MSALPATRPRQTASALDAAFADFLRLDLANGDASEDTIRGYRSMVGRWVAWCGEQEVEPATATVADVKRYRQALIEADYKPASIRLLLAVVRRFYEAARNAHALILVTEWNQFRNLNWERMRELLREPVVVDLRNIYEPTRMKALGFRYACVGRKGSAA